MRALAPLASLSGTSVLEPPSGEPAERPRLGAGGGAPPGRGGHGDGGGGGGGGDDGNWSEDGWYRSGGRDPGSDRGAAEFAFWFLLASIGTVFLIFLGAYMMLRQNAAEWPPPGSPGPPDGLIWSTVLLIASDLAMLSTRRAATAGHEGRMRARLGLTIALGLGFVLLQAFLWRDVAAGGLTTSSDAYGAVFFTLTGLHAIHVFGGLIFLCVVALHAARSRTIGPWFGTLRLASWYWHYMDAIWAVLFVVLYAAS